MENNIQPTAPIVSPSVLAAVPVEPKSSGRVWKIIGGILFAIIIIFVLLAWYGFYLEKQELKLEPEKEQDLTTVPDSLNKKNNMEKLNEDKEISDALNAFVDAAKQFDYQVDTSKAGYEAMVTFVMIKDDSGSLKLTIQVLKTPDGLVFADIADASGAAFMKQDEEFARYFSAVQVLTVERGINIKPASN